MKMLNFVLCSRRRGEKELREGEKKLRRRSSLLSLRLSEGQVFSRLA
jgi:hypothetical protein